MAGTPIKLIDQCRVSPPANSVILPSSSSSISITLSPFDIPLSFILNDAANQAKRLLFYEFPNSLNHIVQLKTSLSLALQNFYPYASKLVFPPLPEKPRILYTEGDSVPFTVAESMMDFGELIGDQIKDVKLFHPLIPNLSPKIESEDDGTWIIPDLLAIQVTIFPNSGMCIGIHYNHTVSDGKSLSYFLKSWASICRSGSVETSLIPFLQRDVIEDAYAIQTMQLLKEWSQTFPTTKSPLLSPSFVDVRATFILSKTKITRLKEWILNQFHDQVTTDQHQPTLPNISSFAAACAFTWVCFVKSTEHGGDQAGDDHIGRQLYEFFFVADIRNRLKPPTPEIYFGNCLAFCDVRIEKNVLLGQHGIAYAAKEISEKVKELNDDGRAVRSVKELLSNMKARQVERVLSVSGSPRLEAYDLNFGWGRPEKSEAVHIDGTRMVAISLSETRDEEGGLEIGVALKRAAMDKFTTLFHSFI